MEYRYEDGTVEPNPDFDEFGWAEGDGWRWLYPLGEERKEEIRRERKIEEMYNALVAAGIVSAD